MRTVVALSACLTLLIAGCLAPGATKLDPATGPALLNPDAAGLLNWSAELDGAVVYEITISGAESTECTLESWAVVAGTADSWDNFFLIQQGKDSTYMLQGTAMNRARVQVMGEVDTATFIPPMKWSDPLQAKFTFEGAQTPIVITTGVQGLKSGKGENYQIGLDCTGPHKIQLTGSRDLVVFHPARGHSGVTAHIEGPFAPATALQASIVFDSKAPAVRAILMCSYFLARGQFSGGSAAKPIACDPTPTGDAVLYDFREGSGRYRLDFNEVDAFDGGSWGAFMGLRPLTSFDEVSVLKPAKQACEHLC